MKVYASGAMQANYEDNLAIYFAHKLVLSGAFTREDMKRLYDDIRKTTGVTGVLHIEFGPTGTYAIIRIFDAELPEGYDAYHMSGDENGVFIDTNDIISGEGSEMLNARYNN